jgi:hypothetical protein
MMRAARKLDVLTGKVNTTVVDVGGISLCMTSGPFKRRRKMYLQEMRLFLSKFKSKSNKRGEFKWKEKHSARKVP